MSKITNLKNEIIEKVKEYYYLKHKSETDKFDPIEDCVKYAGRVFDENEMVNLVEAALEFWLTQGRYTKEFEEKFAKSIGVNWALMVNSGSSANLLAVAALTSPRLKERRIKKGDEIITVAAGFPTTVAPIVQLGAIPVFVDVNIDTLNINVNELEKALSKKTKAIMVAHTLGNPFEIDEVVKFCKKNNLWLIEDNCDALGSMYNNKNTGTYGDIGTSSFYPPHHLTTGEGGAVYTNNKLLKNILLSLRDWGRDCWCESGVDNTCGARFSQRHGKLPSGYDHKYIYSHFGFNLKATDLQASIGVKQLDKLVDFTEKRKKNHKLLLEGLKKFEEYFIFQKETENSIPSWFGFSLIVKENKYFKKNDIVNFLENNRVQTRSLFAGNMIYHPLFDHLVNGEDYRVIGELENTNNIMENCFWIGVFPGMKKGAVEFMINKINEFIEIKIKSNGVLK